jgi:hypothetical protein
MCRSLNFPQNLAELLDQLGISSRSTRGIQRHHSFNHLNRFLPKPWRKGTQIGRMFLQFPKRLQRDVVGFARRSSSQGVKQRRPETEDITPEILRLFCEFFRSDVVWSPPNLSQCWHAQSEIHKLHGARLGEQNIRRLDIAVQEAMRKERCQSLSRFDSSLQHGFLIETTPHMNPIIKRPAYKEFHRQIEIPLCFSNLKNPDDVGVVDPGYGMGLGLVVS